MIDTVVAVIGSPKGVDDLEVEVGLPNAEMQEPTVTADAVVVVIWWMVVEDLHGSSYPGKFSRRATRSSRR